LQSARARQGNGVSGATSDAGDAHVLADLVRTHSHQLCTVAGDSAQAEAVKGLTRMHQSLIWDRTRQLLRLRSSLREFFPAALEAYEDLASPDVLELLTKAPEPDRAARLTRAQIAALEGPVEACFGQQPDAEIYLSQPGLGPILGARVLAEFGDLGQEESRPGPLCAEQPPGRRRSSAGIQRPERDHQEPAPTTARRGTATSATTQPCASSVTVWSASCTAASKRTPATTRQPRGTCTPNE